MKFGKYLAARQLEFPEYSGQFINYKALKKLINSLALPSHFNDSNLDQESILKEKKGSFFFKLERELEKVNSFYLEKESELRIRLDILIEKKQKALLQGRLDNNKNSIAYLSLYDGFKKFSKDLDRLEQFVELNEIGFTKVLKKWDKRSKSHTKELYLTTAVNVQPVFHRNEIIELSDLVANNLLELEAKAEGDNIIRYSRDIENVKKIGNTSSGASGDEATSEDNRHNLSDREIDDLYSEYVTVITQLQQMQQQQYGLDYSSLNNFYNNVSKIDDIKISKIFLLSASNYKIHDDLLQDFYNRFANKIDLSIVDDLNGRNFLHESSLCKTNNMRIFLIQLCLQNEKLDPTIKDISGKTALHYSSEIGRDDILKLLIENTPHSELDSLDNDSMTPLLLAIINNKIACLKLLLDNGANPLPLQDDIRPKYLPLNVACKIGNLEIVELLLNHTNNQDHIFQPNAEGLLPLHIVANFGHHQLIPILIKYGAKINQLDKLNKWAPIFYSATEGHSQTTLKLVEYGANFNLKDEEGLKPLYYAAWEGHVGVLNVLLDAAKKEKLKAEKASAKPTEPETSLIHDRGQASVPPPVLKFNESNINNIELIPDLSLPPPIIPVRKYGHNFLEKKIFLKLNFYTGRDSIKLYKNQFLSSIPGRVTINCAQNDIIPRNLLLPILDIDKTITFQIDSLKNFQIDFELYPTFGTRLIAKTTLLSVMFNDNESRSCFSDINDNVNLVGDLVLPLFDIRLKNLGDLRFNYQIIYPYSGIPLEISEYDTYWKSTNNNSELDHSNNDKAISVTTTKRSFSFVTASSLSGEYYRIFICMLNDGTPIVCPDWRIDVGNGLKIPISNLTLSQLNNIVGDVSNLINESLTGNNNKNLLSRIYTPLDLFLEKIPINISLDLEIFYPTLYESNYSNLQIAKNAVGLNNNLNKYIDSILSIVFEHVRSSSSTKNRSRSLVFSSSNSIVCTILNWKQPNYPVFYIMNGIKVDNDSSSNNTFKKTTANGFEVLEENCLNKIKEKIVRKNLSNIINKNSNIYNNELLTQDSITRSVKLSTNFAVMNNLLGIIIPSKLIKVCPELIKNIRLRGLILVSSNDISDQDADTDLDEVDDDTKMDIDGNIARIGENDDVNGLKFNGILSFKDAIDM
ncbi:hypothetical protein PACTADRAFT_69139 [Pachysolen tannophilus NRRL Y-2460]|uniref:SPX domain-containing protein n=1 Tax=Pachysolen tannophilus NRRL Y-2460 TaxID=669874 RepID=A0A1E4TV84_PACTA|nr:hypothetical protein PACTADRAFT_69139 [Pachysolen tannophilus NRRL Y-2460]